MSMWKRLIKGCKAAVIFRDAPRIGHAAKLAGDICKVVKSETECNTDGVSKPGRPVGVPRTIGNDCLFLKLAVQQVSNIDWGGTLVDGPLSADAVKIKGGFLE